MMYTSYQNKPQTIKIGEERAEVISTPPAVKYFTRAALDPSDPGYQTFAELMLHPNHRALIITLDGEVQHTVRMADSELGCVRRAMKDSFGHFLIEHHIVADLVSICHDNHGEKDVHIFIFSDVQDPMKTEHIREETLWGKVEIFAAVSKDEELKAIALARKRAGVPAI